MRQKTQTSQIATMRKGENTMSKIQKMLPENQANENQPNAKQEVSLASVAKEAVKKVNELTGENITNPYLAEATVKIANAMKTAAESYYIIGSELKRVRDDKLYKKDYNTFEAYTQRLFGLEKGQAYRAIQIVSNLYTKDGKQFMDGIYRFSDGQLNELKNICGENTTPETAAAAVLELGITPTMKGVEINKLIKEYKQKNGTAGTNTKKPSTTAEKPTTQAEKPTTQADIPDFAKRANRVFWHIVDEISTLNEIELRAIASRLFDDWSKQGLIGNSDRIEDNKTAAEIAKYFPAP